jgi:hypothetical protein
MSFISSIKHTLAIAVAETELSELGRPYGVKAVNALETRSGGQFAATVDLSGDRYLRLTGTLRFADDTVTVVALNTGREWLDRVADLHLINRPLPISPDTVRRLKKLWPD